MTQLVRVTTSDGGTLDGALDRPDSTATGTVILVHGTGSNFYQSTLLAYFAERFVARGLAALRVNTRGHDAVSIATTTRGGARLGAAFETVDDCRHDLAAWLAFAKAEVGPAVWLFGHSLGAVKCVYATAYDRLEAAGLIALSPPRLSYSWFCESSRRDDFLATYRRAESLIGAGQAMSLMDVTMPLPTLISAAGYIEKYGPEERINFVPLVKRLRVPATFLFGEKEVESNPAFQNLPNDVPGAIVIAGADHFYTGVRDAAWDAVQRWLDRD